MDVIGAPTLVGHASAAIKRWLLAICSFVRLFNGCDWRSNARWSCLGCDQEVVVGDLFVCSFV
jgi:hypothetical protein